ncbi:MAG: ComF family protein [Candidatus Marinimicrobia bacterium]|nr:ComF family protein [Candidatus Neomarinimicrobiota bacterium]MBL7010535.1 ComF family protein [Candidatus Neomarinimicrobiota bacterium]MBL7030455.1 ComF family protein [Candidatus Neomarinimicrobiota bacterium]
MMKLVFPNACLSCREDLDLGILCNSCQNKLEKTSLQNRIEEIHFPEFIDEAYVCWWYNDALQDVIHKMKYSDRARIGSELGRLAGEIMGHTIGHLDYLTAVPLHHVKKRDRGYNQALWIGKGFAKTVKIPMDPSILKRKTHTVSQTTLDREERLQNMENAFVSSRPLKGLKIGIIDDVLTTGATMSACAKALKDKGAAQVTAITLGTPIINL